MAYQEKPGSGSLFKNDKKTEEKHPDYRGSMMCPVCKAALWLSSWIKRSADKPAFMSISAQSKDKDAKPAASAEPQWTDTGDTPF